MKTSCKPSIVAWVIFVGLASVALPAQAGAGVRIRFRDLDLASSEGIAALYQRIELGARLVCGDGSSSWDASRVVNLRRCYAAAIEEAVATVNHPQLTALHLEKSSKRIQVSAVSKTQ